MASSSSKPTPSTRAIQSLPLEGKQPLFYFPSLNLLSFDGEADARLSVPEDFGDILFRYFLGVRRLTALKLAQQPPQALFVEPWRKCNLACTYCYAESGPEFSKKADARKVADVARRYPFKRALVFGGEPLLDPKFLLDLYRVQKWDSFFLSTNGLLLDEASSQELLSQPGVSVQVSLEPREWAYRVTTAGKKQFELMRDKLKSLGKLRPSLRVTIPQDAPHVPLKAFVDDLAEAIGGWNFSVSYWPARAPAPPPWLKDWFEESYALIKEDPERKYGDKLPGGQLASYFQEMAKTKNGFRFHNCNAGHGAVAIGPDNVLHGCHELAVVESEQDGVSAGHNPQVIDETKRSALVHKWSGVMDHEVCSGCPARYLCGGVCFILEPPNSACVYISEMAGLGLAEMIQYNASEVMNSVSRSEENLKELLSMREGLAKEVNGKKWNRLVSGELPLAEAVELAGQLLSD